MGYIAAEMLYSSASKSSFPKPIRINCRTRTMAITKCAASRNQLIFETLKAAPFAIAQPALALVDDRLAGEGTGKALGINDPILGWVIIGVFTAVWAFYYIATKDLGGQRDEDGLGL